jgi:hypothetical protein
VEKQIIFELCIYRTVFNNKTLSSPDFVDQAHVVGNDIGHGEIRGRGNHPGQGFVLLVEAFQAPIGDGADADLDGGEGDGALDDGRYFLTTPPKRTKP